MFYYHYIYTIFLIYENLDESDANSGMVLWK